MSENGFTRDQIIQLNINLHQLALTQGDSYIVLPQWIAKKESDKFKKLQ